MRKQAGDSIGQMERDEHAAKPDFRRFYVNDDRRAHFCGHLYLRPGIQPAAQQRGEAYPADGGAGERAARRAARADRLADDPGGDQRLCAKAAAPGSGRRPLRIRPAPVAAADREHLYGLFGGHSLDGALHRGLPALVPARPDQPERAGLAGDDPADRPGKGTARLVRTRPVAAGHRAGHAPHQPDRPGLRGGRLSGGSAQPRLLRDERAGGGRWGGPRRRRVHAARGCARRPDHFGPCGRGGQDSARADRVHRLRRRRGAAVRAAAVPHDRLDARAAHAGPRFDRRDLGAPHRDSRIDRHRRGGVFAADPAVVHAHHATHPEADAHDAGRAARRAQAEPVAVAADRVPGDPGAEQHLQPDGDAHERADPGRVREGDHPEPHRAQSAAGADQSALPVQHAGSILLVARGQGG